MGEKKERWDTERVRGELRRHKESQRRARSGRDKPQHEAVARLSSGYTHICMERGKHTKADRPRTGANTPTERVPSPSPQH